MKSLANWRPPLWVLAFAAVTGLGLSLAYPPHNIWWITPLGQGCLFLLAYTLEPKKAFIAAWVFALACAVGMMWWLTIVMTRYGGMPSALAWATVFFCMAIMALYATIATGLIAYLRVKGITPLFSAPLLWTASEWLRGVLFTGFPWVPMPTGLVSRPELIQTAEWWGVNGLSFILALAAVLLAKAALPLLRRQAPGRNEAVALACVFAIFAAGWLWGDARMVQVRNQTQAAPKLTVTVVQGDVRIEELWKRAMRYKIVERQADLSAEAAAKATSRPWLIVWPESAVPYYFSYDKTGDAIIKQTAQSLQAYLMVASLGAVPQDGKLATSNRSWLIDPQGVIIGRYDKAHLVPFGEYVPLRSLLFWVRAIAQIGDDQYPGQPGVTVDVEGTKIGPLICYESIFAYLARAQRQNGARLLVNQTNDAWYGMSGASSQHMSHLVFRCIETRLACARAAITGISGFIMPDGEMSKTIGLQQRGTLTMRLPLMDTETFYVRHGEIVGPLCAVLCLPLILWGRLRRKTNRSA